MKDLKKYSTNVLLKLDEHPNIFDLIKNGITVTNSDSTILYTNPAFTRITGYTREEVKGKNPGILHSGFHTKKFYEKMWTDIHTKDFWEGEIWNRRKSGEVYPELLTISKVNQETPGHFYYIAVFSDISFLKSDVNKRFHLAFYDPLTELANKNHFLDRLYKSNEKKLTLFYMDLDMFKEVNDTFGHCVGDSVLRDVGKRLSSLCRGRDVMARIGGDEFAVILASNRSKQFSIEFAKRILHSIETPFNINGILINISISIGISSYPDDTSNLEELLINSDKAMYTAKKNGTKIECWNE